MTILQVKETLTDMAQPDPSTGVFRVAELSARKPTRFALAPEAQARAAIARKLDLSALRKLRFEGEIAPLGKRGWQLSAHLGATLVQPCVVTLAPVTTRIDEKVLRRYLPADEMPNPEAGSETEMPEDDSIDTLDEVIRVYDAMIEALALALPPYPRAEGVSLGEAVYAQDGATPLRDSDLKPFAGLAGLRDALDDPDSSEG